MPNKKKVPKLVDAKTFVGDAVALSGYAQAVPEVTGGVQPLTQEFGNGDMNVLRDKINEIIKAR